MKEKVSKKIANVFTLLALVAVGLSSLLNTNILTVNAADDSQATPPTTVNINIHKLMYDKETPLSEKDMIENDGYTKTKLPDGVSTYSKATYGDVEFTIYDLTAQLLPDKKSQLTDDQIVSVINDVEQSGTESEYIKKATESKTGAVNEDGVVTFANQKAYSKGQRSAYLVYETKSPKGLVSQKASPMLFVAPLTTADQKGFLKEINVYPKNITQKLNFELTKFGDDGTEKVNAKALAGAKFSLYKGELGKGEKLGDLTADKDGKLTATNLTLGKYYFVENPSDVVAAPDETPVPKGKYLLGADARNDENNKLGFEITAAGVEPESLKGSYINYLPPEAKKEVLNGVGSEKSFQVGDLVQYKGTVRIPNDVSGGKKGIDMNGKETETQHYHILNWKDIGGKGLTFVPSKGDIHVFGGEQELKKDTDYSVKEVENGFVVDFIVNNGKVSDSVAALAGKDITIEYKMVVNEDAVVADPLNNSFDLSYNNNPYDTEGQETKHIIGEVPVYTFGALFRKEDSGLAGSGLAKTPLEGAVFVVKNSEGSFYAGLSDADKDGVKEAIWEKEQGKAETLTSDKEGKFQITGLREGEYILSEIQAPNGYQKLLEDISFKVNKDTFKEENTVIVENDQMAFLPRTGSQWGALVGLTGVGLSAVAGFVYYMRKKQA